VTRDSQRAKPKAKGLFDVFIDLQVLHAAIKETITVQQLVDVLTRRGYEVSSRSISTVVRRFERRGWLGWRNEERKRASISSYSRWQESS